MSSYLRVAAVITVVAVAGAAALYAFGSGPNVGAGPTSQPTTQPTLTQPTASTVNPDPPLGAFDLDTFEGRFDVKFSTGTVDTGNILYSADLDFPLGLGFIVDPNDPNNAIVGSVISSPLPDDNAAAEDEWLAFIALTQPDAAAWLRSERENILAARGADVDRAKWFGGLCAAISTPPLSVIEPASDATYLYMFVQYEEDCP